MTKPNYGGRLMLNNLNTKCPSCINLPLWSIFVVPFFDTPIGTPGATPCSWPNKCFARGRLHEGAGLNASATVSKLGSSKWQSGAQFERPLWGDWTRESGGTKKSIEKHYIILYLYILVRWSANWEAGHFHLRSNISMFWHVVPKTCKGQQALSQWEVEVYDQVLSLTDIARARHGARSWFNKQRSCYDQAQTEKMHLLWLKRSDATRSLLSNSLVFLCHVDGFGSDLPAAARMHLYKDSWAPASRRHACTNWPAFRQENDLSFQIKHNTL